MKSLPVCLIAGLMILVLPAATTVAGERVKTFTFEDIRSVDIETVSGNIKITPGEVDQLTVELINDLDKPELLDPELEADDGELSIEENFTGNRIRGSTYWTIYLPKPFVLRSINCSTASGDMLFEEFEVDFLEAESASGEMSVNSVDAKEVELSTASGAIILEDCEGDYIEAESASGRISTSSVHARELDLSTASGKIVIEDCDADFIKTSSASGRISVGSVIAKELEVSNASGRIVVDNSDIRETAELSCASGDLKIYLSHLPSKSLNASSASGDVDLNVPKFGENFSMTLMKRADKGRIKCPFEYTEKETIRLHKSDRYLTDRYLVKQGKGGPEIELSTASGTIRIETKNRGI